MDLFQKQQHEFHQRHIGPTEQETNTMLRIAGVTGIDELIDNTLPASIRSAAPLDIPDPVSEAQYLAELTTVAAKNKVFKSYIGQGYYNTFTPSVILRNVFQNPGWYTQYTPYQAEIAQGRLESLLNFQTMVADLTGLPIANASLLDEGTALAEAMTLFFNLKNKVADKISCPRFFVDDRIFAQSKDLLITRATPLHIELIFGNYETAVIDASYFGAAVQYPDATGNIPNYKDFIEKVHSAGAYIVMATDLLALTLLTSPGELGADVAVGNSQRFGVPMGFGGPHAAFFAAKDEFKRIIPGRIIGISIDAQGNRALRMALQTREQHIKREKATSNICTAQALLANMAAMYGVYHGPGGLKDIATRVSLLTKALAAALPKIGAGNIYKIKNRFFFDTIAVEVIDSKAIKAIGEQYDVNFYMAGSRLVCISLDETTTIADVELIVKIFGQAVDCPPVPLDVHAEMLDNIPTALTRTSEYMTHPVFNTYHSETEMMRYLKKLENRDLSLNYSMISLGSCTMKLNAATELIPVSWPAFSAIHPFAPVSQWRGYQQIFTELEAWLSTITGFAKTSLQPNSGAQGEYAGLLTIKGYHQSRNEAHRNVVLIPISAHGTNPASAVMAGFKVVVVKSDDEGHIDIEDLKAKATLHRDNLGALMVTYPSTHGVFEEGIKELCETIHQNGGMVYMDGANMNAQVGLTAPGIIGADVCHLNLHKTFAIPHGGGGPGMGPICVNEKLAPFLPKHISQSQNVLISGSLPAPSNSPNGGEPEIAGSGAVSAAAYGSASILLISYAYIKMLGWSGVTKATQYAILNANYMKAKLQKNYTILYSGKNGTCAHEFIVDLRPFKQSCGIEAEDVAKRLIDYGFHAPTMSFPVPGTIMIEPTESEDKAELDRFCDAMNSIYTEIKQVETGLMDKLDNPLKNAPHTQHLVCADEWNHPYSRQVAAFPLSYVRENKFWPAVGRVNNTFGDRNLACTCEPVSAYESEDANMTT